MNLLTPFGINRFFTNIWGGYDRILDPATHVAGKQNTQKIERKHLTLRTQIKRLARRTICFSKSILMRDIVIGLFINRYEFILPISTGTSTTLQYYPLSYCTLTVKC